MKVSTLRRLLRDLPDQDAEVWLSITFDGMNRAITPVDEYQPPFIDEQGDVIITGEDA